MTMPTRTRDHTDDGARTTSRRVGLSLRDVAPRQPSLLEPAGADLSFDRHLSSIRRVELSQGAWVDVAAGFARRSHDLFDLVVDAADWRAEEMVLFDEVVACPRLSVRWRVGELPDDLAILRSMAATLSQRYRLALTRVSANLYRDGRDSVAWHGDRGARDRDQATIAVLSLGATRPFQLRERHGHGRVDLAPTSGDLLVMGGTCQRTWWHAVPKVADAGPRIAVMFRTPQDG